MDPLVHTSAPFLSLCLPLILFCLLLLMEHKLILSQIHLISVGSIPVDDGLEVHLPTSPYCEEMTGVIAANG